MEEKMTEDMERGPFADFSLFSPIVVTTLLKYRKLIRLFFFTNLFLNIITNMIHKVVKTPNFGKQCGRFKILIEI